MLPENHLSFSLHNQKLGHIILLEKYGIYGSMEMKIIQNMPKAYALEKMVRYY